MGFLGFLQLRSTRRKLITFAVLAGMILATIPLLPKSYTERMNTIQTYSSEGSASTRLAVWKWALDYVQEHPFGGGFQVYLGNKISVDMSYKTEDGTIVKVVGYDSARAFHNSYFEILGEQGYIGLALFILIHLTGIIRMEVVRRTYAKTEGEHAWVAPLATALQHAHLIYLLGCSFVGIAFQTYIYFMVALEIGLDRYVQLYVKKRTWNPFRRRERSEPAAPAPPPEETIEAEPEAAPAPAKWGQRRENTARWGAAKPANPARRPTGS